MKKVLFIILIGCIVSCGTHNKYRNCPVVDASNKIEIHG